MNIAKIHSDQHLEPFEPTLKRLHLEFLAIAVSLQANRKILKFRTGVNFIDYSHAESIVNKLAKKVIKTWHA